MKYALFIFASLAVLLLDWHCYDVICSRGGFSAWMQTNCFWQVAILYIVCFNIMYLVGAAVFYDIVKED